MQPIGWGVIGCGRVAEHRVVPAIRRTSGARMAAFCSRNATRAADFARRFEAPGAYDSIDSFLNDDRVHAVYVATPNDQHADQVITCLKAGKHVLTDKPMALSISQCEDMRAAASRAGRILGVCHQQRFHPAHADCFRLIKAGALGRLTILRAEMGFLFRPADAWRLRPNHAGGGPGMDLAPHAVDILLKAAGPAKSVVGRVANVRFDFEVEDFFHAQIDFESGAVGLVEMTYCSHSYGGRLEICGDEGSFVADGSLMAAERYRSALMSGPSRTPSEAKEGEHRDCFGAAIEDFCGAISAGREPTVSSMDGLEVMRVVLGAYESAKSGVAVRIATS